LRSFFYGGCDVVYAEREQPWIQAGMITAILWSGAAGVADNGFCDYLDALPLLTAPNLL